MLSRARLMISVVMCACFVSVIDAVDLYKKWWIILGVVYNFWFGFVKLCDADVLDRCIRVLFALLNPAGLNHFVQLTTSKCGVYIFKVVNLYFWLVVYPAICSLEFFCSRICVINLLEILWVYWDYYPNWLNIYANLRRLILGL